MKGLYMVDADRGFVQYFENLLFTHSKEYKMLGHNFKANEFLLKIKERPDLLDKIDLLFINPKLNDLNGLELYKKIQSKRKDINVCILVNENIKTFYENDIAELGIENVILYPNSDEYYLNSVREIFEKIDKKHNVSLGGESSIQSKKESISDKDLFSELNSEEFLSQFDFDALSSDMFGSKESITKEEVKLDNTNIASSSNDYFKPVFENENNSNYGMLNNETPVNSGFNENAPSFVKPTFVDEDNNSKTNDIFGFGEVNVSNPSSQTNINNYDIFNNGPDNSVENNFSHMDNSFSNMDNNFDFENQYVENQYTKNPYTENPYAPYEENPYNQGLDNNFKVDNPYNQNVPNIFDTSNDSSNPLDLSAFGVGSTSNNKKDFNIFETPEFEPNNKSNDIFGNSNLDNDIFSGSGFNNQKVDNGFDMVNNNYKKPDYFESNTQNKADFLTPGFDLDNFEAPYENNGAVQKTNLQDINRPDIDTIDNFANYGETQRFANKNYGENNNQFGNAINVNDKEPVNGRHSGFNNSPNLDPAFGSPNVGFNSGMQFKKEPEIKANPYDEYLNVSKGMDNKQGLGGNMGYPTPTDFNPNKNENKQFNGFDFGKTTNAQPKPDFNNSGFGNNPMQGAPVGNNFNSPNDNMGYPKMDLDMDDKLSNTSNKSYIENMYNNVGVEDLNYAPSTSNNVGNAPIRHERTADSTYNQVPDFARQIVAFYSTKGGIGKTSLAVNATIQLAKYSKKKICLIDFDLTNANVHTHLGILDSTYDLSVVSNFESEIDSFSLSRIVTPYRVKDKNGETVEFDVIVGFKEMKMAQRFSEKEVYKILSILEEMYDVVIVDTHPVYTDLAVSTILKKATKIVFVTEQEMTALNGAKDFILASKKYSIPSEKLFMVLNRYKAQTSIFNKNRIEKGLNKTVLATIPFDMDSLRDAVNTNNPVTISNPDSELARAYIDVAKVIDPKIVIPEENKGFFKLFKR